MVTTAGTGRQELQPDTTSLNEPTYAADPVGVTDLIPRDAPDQVQERPTAPRRAVPPLSYQLLTPPRYDTIVGGVAPSPFVSFLVLLGFGGLILGALLGGWGADAGQLWLLGGLFLVIGATLAAFVSRSA